MSTGRLDLTAVAVQEIRQLTREVEHAQEVAGLRNEVLNAFVKGLWAQSGTDLRVAGLELDGPRPHLKLSRAFAVKCDGDECTASTSVDDPEVLPGAWTRDGERTFCPGCSMLRDGWEGDAAHDAELAGGPADD